MPPSIRPRTSPSREQARETSSTPATKNTDTNTTALVDQRNTAPTTDSMMLASSPLFSTGMYGAGMGTSMYGMGGSMYGAGMMGSPYYGGGMMGPMTSLNQFLFSLQSVIFSLGQAVQIVGMNTQAVHQLLDTATTMFDHALVTFKEMRALDASVTETEEDKKRRRRLKALRWAMIMGFAYGGYRLIRRMMRRRMSASTHRQTIQAPTMQTSSAVYPYTTPQSYEANPYVVPHSYGGNHYSSYPVGGTSMYPPNGYGGTYGGAYY